jgi:hypothetical protein
MNPERVEVYSLQYRVRSSRQVCTRYFLTREERRAHERILNMDADVECIGMQCNYWLPETVLGQFGTRVNPTEVIYYVD